MKPQRNYTDYLHDMLEQARLAEEFIAAMTYEEFELDQKTQFAVLFAITVIGEAARNIPASVRDTYPDIPWRTIINTRNRLIHGYDSIVLYLIWNVVKQDIPPLKAQIAAILEAERIT